MRKILVLVMLCLLPVTIRAQETDISPTLAEELFAIEAWVIETRGLEPQGPVIRVFPSREEVSDFLLTELTEQLPAETVREAMAFYVAFDFMSPEVDLVDVYLTLIEDQIGGYYNPEDQTMNTILISGNELGDSLPSLEKTIYAHEFVHALQDQVFGLEAIGLSDEGVETLSTDEIIAIQGLVEGDATIVMSLYMEHLMEQNPFSALGMLSGSLASGSLAIPPGTPPILMEELLFPYNQGAVFVTELWRDGGWEAVDAAFETLPQSSEHLLHPESYFNGDQPIPVEIADASAALGDGWTLATSDRLGEFYLRAYLENQLSREVAGPAAAGWGGDQYNVYTTEAGEIAYAARIVWDTPADRTEFADAFARFAATRTSAETPQAGCWAGEDAICLGQTADGVTVIVRAPNVTLAAALLDNS
jgi:hypothetical protein